MKRCVLILLLLLLMLIPVCVYAGNAEYLYITESVGAESITVTQDGATGAGWSWDAENAVLTLNNYNGSTIEVPSGDITIELKGTNRITMPTVGIDNSSYGIHVKSGKLTIRASESDPDAALWIGNTDLSTSDQYNTAVSIDGYYKFNLESGSLEIEMVNTAAYSYQLTGISISGESVYIQGDAVLTVNINSGAFLANALSCGVKYGSSRDMSITVTGSNSRSIAVSSFTSTESGTGDVLLSCPNGFALGSGGFYIHENAGDIKLQGLLMEDSSWSGNYFKYPYYYNIPSNHRFETAGGEALECAFAWYQPDPNKGGGFYLTDPAGEPITDCVLAAKGETQPLHFVDSVLFDLPSMKTETSMGTAYFHGAVFGGMRPYTFSVKDGTSMPDGLQIRQYSEINYGMFYANIYGTPTTPGPAGSFVLVVTDSSEPAQTAEITVNYPEIVEKEKPMTVNGLSFDSKLDEDAGQHPSWHWVAETSTLYLTGYTGGTIVRESGDINIVLSGTNTVNVPDALNDCDYCCGISATAGALTITKSGASASLWVGNQAINTYYAYYCGLAAYNDLSIEDAAVSIEFTDASENPGYYRYGTNSNIGSTYIKGSAALNIILDSANSECLGIGRGLYFQSSGNVVVRALGDARSSACSGIISSAKGTGNITLISPNGYTISPGILALHENFGTLTLQGYTRNGTTRSDGYMTTINNLNIPSNHRFETSGGDPVSAGFVYYDDGARSGYFLLNDEGTPITNCRLAPVNGTKALTFLDNNVFDIPSLKVGESYTGVYFNGAALGGTRPYTFSIKDGTEMPEGFEIRQNDRFGNDIYRDFYAYIKGSPTTTYSAGSFVLVVSDSSATPQTAEITVNYAASSVDYPVTAVTISQTDADIITGNTLTLTAEVVPDTATVKTILWTVSDPETLQIISQSSGSCTVRALKAGEASVIATSKEGGKTKSCTLTITDPAPQIHAEIDAENHKIAYTAWVPQGGRLAAAVYNAEGRFVDFMWSLPYHGLNTNYIYGVDLNKTYRFMIIDAAFAPACEAVTAE